MSTEGEGRVKGWDGGEGGVVRGSHTRGERKEVKARWMGAQGINVLQALGMGARSCREEGFLLHQLRGWASEETERNGRLMMDATAR
jgi:hypothetical protein